MNEHRQKAIDAGEPMYFTGEPCVNGHVARRHVSNSKCESCASNFTEAHKARIHSLNAEVVGSRFGRLTVATIQYAPGKARWRCICDCGNEITTRAEVVKRGEAQSCGCFRKESARRNQQIGAEARRLEPSVLKANQLRRNRDQSEKLTDSYVKHALQALMVTKEIPYHLVEIKREQLRLRRAVTQAKAALKQEQK